MGIFDKAKEQAENVENMVRDKAGQLTQDKDQDGQQPADQSGGQQQADQSGGQSDQDMMQKAQSIIGRQGSDQNSGQDQAQDQG
jgi:hypothetical protein